MLIDGGGSAFSDFEVGKQLVLPFLLQKRIRIRWVCCSHFHPDHAAGLLDIIPIIKPEAILIGAAPNQSPYYRRLKTIGQAYSRIERISSGYTIEYGDNLISCLYPPEFINSPSTHNNHSLVLHAQNRYHSFLFTGDIEAEAEEYLVVNRCYDLKATVIKVPHHGSKTSSTPSFVECVSPKLAVVSCASNNRFQFPNRIVISNYKKHSAKVLSTARYGGIRIQAGPGPRPLIEVSK